uniref:PR domain zinc finger protein 1 n=1 Tax=Mola mola TaxID=94237 RepID=A0A3Q3WVX6_MOLML
MCGSSQGFTASTEYTMLTSEASAQSSGIITAAMPQAQDVDKASWSEADFEEKCTYIAKDQPLEEDFKSNRTRAERSLPRILALRRCPNSAEVLGVTSREQIPKGTRFGPLVGESYTEETLPKDADRKYFWRVFLEGHLHHILDGLNEERSNWMRYVNPACTVEEQNLVACQTGLDIYFYTIKPLHPGQELLVWYCQEFAQRCNYPPRGQLAIDGTEKSQAQKKTTGKQGHSVSDILRDRPTKSLTACSTRSDSPLSETPVVFPLCPRVVYPIEPYSGPLHGHKYTSLLSLPSCSPPAGKRQTPSSHVTSGLNYTFQHSQGPVKPYQQPPAPYLLPYYQLGLNSVLPHSYPLYPNGLKPHLMLSSHLLPLDSYPHFPHPLANGQKDIRLALSNTKQDFILSPTSEHNKDLASKRTNYLRIPSDEPRDFKKSSPSNVNMELTVPATSSASSMVTSRHRALPSLTHGGCSPPVGMAAISDCLPSKPTSATQSNTTHAMDLRKAKRAGPIIGYKTLSYPLTRQNGKIRYDCNICGKVFGQLSVRNYWLKRSRIYQIYKTHKDISTSNLKTHQRLHSGERPYQCKLCPARFTQFVHLKLHKRLHTGERPHRCPRCPCAYLHYCSLQVHLQGFCPLSPSASHKHSPEDLQRVNVEIERFDVSEAAEQLEAMATEAKMDKGNVTALIKGMEIHTSGYRGGVKAETELSPCPASECSASQLHNGSSLPLHPTSIKLESGYVSEP